jgi:hypothetical protein
MVEQAVSSQDPAFDLARRALGHVLAVAPSQLRGDTPLPDVGADSVALLVFADVVEGFAAQSGVGALQIDSARLRVARNVADLANSIVWRSHNG